MYHFVFLPDDAREAPHPGVRLVDAVAIGETRRSNAPFGEWGLDDLAVVQARGMSWELACDSPWVLELARSGPRQTVRG